MTHDPVNKPAHYTTHPSNVECVEITEHLPYCLGAAIKYIFRGGNKDIAPILQDLEKARWYIQRQMNWEEREEITPTPNPYVWKLATKYADHEQEEWRGVIIENLVRGDYLLALAVLNDVIADVKA